MDSNYQLFLVRPKPYCPYSFTALDSSELVSVYENKTKLSKIDKLALLWEFYQDNDVKNLIKISKELKNTYPFILAAAEAHLERVPAKGNIGRPSRTLLQIGYELNNWEFEPVFKEFCKREAIYGFGDLQVKRLFDKLKV